MSADTQPESEPLAEWEKELLAAAEPMISDREALERAIDGLRGWNPPTTEQIVSEVLSVLAERHPQLASRQDVYLVAETDEGDHGRMTGVFEAFTDEAWANRYRYAKVAEADAAERAQAILDRRESEHHQALADYRIVRVTLHN